MEPTNCAQQFVDEEVPLELRQLFPSALRRAYVAADRTIERESYLATPGGKYQRGDLISLAVDHEFEQLIKAGNLPFEPRWEYYAKPTGKHFVMVSQRAHISISQVEDPKKKPRNAVFRDQYAIPNAPYLFEDMNQDFLKVDERRLIHILHGYQDLTFSYLALPHPQKNKHVWQSTNLMNIPHLIETDLAPQEGPTESPTPEVMEELERFLRDDE